MVDGMEGTYLYTYFVVLILDIKIWLWSLLLGFREIFFRYLDWDKIVIFNEKLKYVLNYK